MIVKREYVRFGKLFETDKEAERVFMEAATKSYSEEDRDRILPSLLQFSLCEREMGWCLHDIGKVIDCFEKLDQEKPYETGLLPHETASIEVIGWGRKSVIVKVTSKNSMSLCTTT